MTLAPYPAWDLSAAERLAKAQDVAEHHFVHNEIDCAFAALTLLGAGGEECWSQAWDVIRAMSFALVHRPIGRLLLLSRWHVALELAAPEGAEPPRLVLVRLTDPQAWIALGWGERP